MMSWIAKLLFLRIMGWKIVGHFPKLNKFIIAVVPHTRNLDFVVGVLVRAVLNEQINFIGKKALIKIKEEGVKRLQIGLHIKCKKLSGPNTTFWPLKSDNKIIGKVTSAVYSPRLKKNIALAMVDINYSAIGMEIDVVIDNKNFNCEIIEKPFFDPKKKITSKSL